MPEMRRRGEKSKCPACGWGLDEHAYRCTKCFIYFCYKCRARIGKQEEQYQCADQSCGCYGKLICSACTVTVSDEGPVTRPTYSVDPGEAFSLGGSLGFIACIVAFTSGGAPPGTAVLIGFTTAVTIWLVAIILAFQTTTRTENLATHRCCVQCRRPVKKL